jgi:hypothetical protein
MQKNTRKPYKKPVIKSERIIETAALACGKCLGNGPLTQLACKSKSRTS